jgi:hypothetical protein
MDIITAAGLGVTATLTATHLDIVEPARGAGALLPLEQIERVDHIPPRVGGVVNGHVVVHTTDGDRHEMYYRAEDQGFAFLAELLALAVNG